MLRKIFATFLFSVFVSIFTIFIFLFAQYRIFANENFYSNELSSVVYEFALDNVQDLIKIPEIQKIKSEDFKKIFSDTFIKEDFSAFIRSNIANVKILKVRDNGELPITISLGLLNEKADLFIKNISTYWFSNLSVCEVSIKKMPSDLSCKPKEISAADFEAVVSSSLDRQLLSSLPEDFVFNAKLPMQFSGLKVLDFANDIFIKILLLLFFVCIFVLLCIALVIFSPFIRIVKWICMSLFYASLFDLGILAVLVYVIPKMFEKFFPDFNLFLYNFFSFTLANNLLKLLLPIFIISLGFYIVGVVFDKEKT
ncbi:MAG: hypothetical protein WC806_01665 [Candidatus Gracilibacteria bacterium]|jgi:hypothetical protein